MLGSVRRVREFFLASKFLGKFAGERFLTGVASNVDLPVFGSSKGTLAILKLEKKMNKKYIDRVPYFSHLINTFESLNFYTTFDIAYMQFLNMHLLHSSHIKTWHELDSILGPLEFLRSAIAKDTF